MAIVNMNCFDGSTFILTNAGTGLQYYFVCRGVGCTPTGYVELNAHDHLIFPCDGTLRFEDNGFTSTGYVPILLPVFPYEQLLLGLAGLICASLIAYVFNRS